MKTARAQRKAEVAELLLEGMPTTKVATRIARKYDCSERSVYVDIRAVREKVFPKLYGLGDIAIMRSEALAKAESHYVRCVQDKQHNAGLATLKWIGELQGLTARQQLATEHLELREKIERLREARLKGTEDEVRRAERSVSLSLDAFNLARSYFNMPAMSQEEFETYKQRFVEAPVASPN
jgi:hypothetical protein